MWEYLWQNTELPVAHSLTWQLKPRSFKLDSWLLASSTASLLPVRRAHDRRIADASAHRPEWSMSRRASRLPGTLSKVACMSGQCSSEERSSERSSSAA